MLNKTAKQDSLVQKTTHNSATKDKIAQYGSAQYKRAQHKEQNRIFCRKGSPVLSNQLYFNITAETQSLVSFYHSVSQRAWRLFATEAPCLPITSTLSPRHVKTVPISCRIHLLHCMLTVFYLAWTPLSWQRKWRVVEGRRLRERRRWKGSEGTER